MNVESSRDASSALAFITNPSMGGYSKSICNILPPRDQATSTLQFLGICNSASLDHSSKSTVSPFLEGDRVLEGHISESCEPPSSTRDWAWAHGLRSRTSEECEVGVREYMFWFPSILLYHSCRGKSESDIGEISCLRTTFASGAASPKHDRKSRKLPQTFPATTVVSAKIGSGAKVLGDRAGNKQTLLDPLALPGALPESFC